MDALSEQIGRLDSSGFSVRYLENCTSTSSLLKSQAAELPAGTVLVTDHQTEGRGRLGRSWSSVAGEDLTFSVLLRPDIPPEQAPRLSLAVAVAAAQALETLEGLPGRVSVKWPNDVFIGDRKVCGILLESSVDGERLEWVVAGVGLNVNSDPGAMLEGLGPSERESWRDRPRPTSLLAELGHSVDRGPLLGALLSCLATEVREESWPQVLALLRTHDALEGHSLRVYAGPPDGALVLEGEGAGIGDQGQLLVRDGDGIVVPVFAGEVTLSVDRSRA